MPSVIKKCFLHKQLQGSVRITPGPETCDIFISASPVSIIVVLALQALPQSRSCRISFDRRKPLGGRPTE